MENNYHAPEYPSLTENIHTGNQVIKRDGNTRHSPQRNKVGGKRWGSPKTGKEGSGQSSQSKDATAGICYMVVWPNMYNNK